VSIRGHPLRFITVSSGKYLGLSRWGTITGAKGGHQGNQNGIPSGIYGDDAEDKANYAALGGNAPAVVVGDATQKRLTLYRDGTIGRTKRFILTGAMTAHPRMTAVP
jgi:hypothetical protein